MDLDLRTYRPRLAHSRGGPTGFRRLLTALAAVAMALPLAVAPALALSVSAVTVAPPSPNGTGLAAQYEVTFNTSVALAAAATVTVGFPLGTTIAAAPAAGSITVNTTTCGATNPTAAAATLTPATANVGPIVTLANPVVLTATTACVRFLTSAGVKNPTVANFYHLNVKTSVDSTASVDSADYQISNAALSGSLTGSINVAPPATLSVTLSAPGVGFTLCSDTLANLNGTVATGITPLVTGLQTGTGACATAAFSVTVNSSGAATVKVTGTNATPNAPSTGSGWTLAGAASTGVNAYKLGVGAACTAASTSGLNCTAPSVDLTTGLSVDANFGSSGNGIVAAGATTRSEAATIQAPTVSNSTASSNPTTGFSSSISWVVISNT